MSDIMVCDECGDEYRDGDACHLADLLDAYDVRGDR